MHGYSFLFEYFHFLIKKLGIYDWGDESVGKVLVAQELGPGFESLASQFLKKKTTGYADARTWNQEGPGGFLDRRGSLLLPHMYT